MAAGDEVECKKVAQMRALVEDQDPSAKVLLLLPLIPAAFLVLLFLLCLFTFLFLLFESSGLVDFGRFKITASS